ncbi:hypothetical protein DXG03_006781 [Asterophora parasitica]|uniref:Delta 8-(E)-sphingolipid desaturase n=1 Tax=Asterophora parasitica TaxID=117018 RepID=A0A9P7GDE4_9AGAR|nr:hypothetical protein DXG03_006781 [Asterophora parasitica]
MPHTLRNVSLAELPLPLATHTQERSLLDPLSLITPKREVRTLTRAQIAFLISQGHLLTLHRGFVYRLNSLLASHPGGELGVLHYIGRDATDEIESVHPVFALERMKHFVVGKVADEDWPGEDVVDSIGWKPLVPPVHLGWPGKAEAYIGVPSVQNTLALMKLYEVDGYPCKGSPIGTTLPFLLATDLEPPPPPPEICPIRQRQLNISYRKFRREMLQEPGLFDLDWWSLYRWQIYRISAFFLSFIGFYLFATKKWHLAVSAVSLGFWMHQIMFIAHDAGHTQLTGNRDIDNIIGGFIASYASGMSLGWWSSQHDVHHMVTNHPEHDPDIQLLPFFAFNTRFFDSLYSTFHACTMHFDAPTRFLIQYQHVFFYPVMIFARFSLIGKSYYYLATKAKADWFRTYEVVGIAVWFVWFGLLLKNMSNGGLDGWVTRAAYVFIMLVSVCPIHVQIVLSHSAQDSNDMGVYEGFVHRQLRTTMDVSCRSDLDWIHGGLHMQIAHHLFPRLSRPNLRRATVYVKQWALENKIEFKEMNFTQGNDQMVGMLADIAGQCRALCAKADDIARGVVPLE